MRVPLSNFEGDPEVLVPLLDYASKKFFCSMLNSNIRTIEH